ncbi:gas vesicle protein [Actinomadura kijaniata]|uniref:gas vesicle protein n=1 Tax=Actinomadura kijaniata TaxID=46161 RepID=UPI003F1A3CFC
MSEISWAQGRGPARQMGGPPTQGGGANLADLLERILDKGIVIVGDIRVNLLDIELLTIKLRLLVASVDRAKEMGIDWWEHDPALSSKARAAQDSVEGGTGDGDTEQQLREENRMLRERLAALETRVLNTPETAAAASSDTAASDEADETDEADAAPAGDDQDGGGGDNGNEHGTRDSGKEGRP